MIISKHNPTAGARTSRRKWRNVEITPDLRKQIEAGLPDKPPEPAPAPVLTAITYTHRQICYQPFNWGWLIKARDQWHYDNIELPALMLTDEFQTIATEHKAKETKELLALGYAPVPDRELSVIEHFQIECLGCGSTFGYTTTSYSQADCIRQAWERFYDGSGCPNCGPDKIPDSVRDSVAKRVQLDRERELEELCRVGKQAEAWRRAFRYKNGYDLQ